VTFHDGEKLDAARSSFNLERHKTMQGSNRRGELAPLASVDVVDPMTGAAQPERAVLAAARRAGRPRRDDGVAQGRAGRGAEFRHPARCAPGPFKFVERVAQDRITVERYDGYWNKANVHVDRSPTRRSPTPRCAWPT
jgi:peptide/nickel transport system substrate-binding protein